jgi:hypothetical protein
VAASVAIADSCATPSILLLAPHYTEPTGGQPPFFRRISSAVLSDSMYTDHLFCFVLVKAQKALGDEPLAISLTRADAAGQGALLYLTIVCHRLVAGGVDRDERN